MAVIFGSARHDENNNYSGGDVGDQLQTKVNDYTGEVSMQTGYVHTKGWVILRPKTDDLANRLAYAMQIACNNKHLGYDQGNRLGVMTYGIDTTTDTECDCSSLVRACLKYCGITVSNFTTANAATVIMNSGYFTKVTFTSLSTVKTGDILCTKSKGHIVIAIQGVSRSTTTSSSYSQADFIADVESILGVSSTKAAFNKTVTISKTTNKNHALVTPLERYMKALGYYTGSIEADNGKTPSFGSGMYTATIKYQQAVVKSGIVDGVISAKGYTWKKLLNIIL